MGKQFVVKKGYEKVRYSVKNPKYYSAGETVTLTDAEYASLPSHLVATVSGTASSVAEPTYPAYPFRQ